MALQQSPPPATRLRELIRRGDRVLAVLHTPSAALAPIMELVGREGGFVGTSGMVGAYTSTYRTQSSRPIRLVSTRLVLTSGSRLERCLPDPHP